MHNPIFCTLSLASLGVLCGCEVESRQCPLIYFEPPPLRVVVRDGETSIAICDAKVELLVEGAASPTPLSAATDNSGACHYAARQTAPSQSASVTVEREGYDRATANVVPNTYNECGDARNPGTTVTLTPAK